MNNETLFADGYGWNPEWPKVGTTMRENLPSGGHSIWVLMHGIRAPRWKCVDSTGPGYVGNLAKVGEETGWVYLGRVPGTPVWPVSVAYMAPGGGS